ncbi:hypothetical protein M4D55_19510 [Metabacillus idriensis]|uniref:hypothetical protein n=1 Tax=Metabacillus idriensis TaxID=324768 RepID=UPI0008A9F0A8|nr:hypothetical protein [Metabacillus idriensis]MCM3597959.1 hypothetical protein [Metabacillus idriensis]OHR73567.1 hypothetical protein HMPREF3291_18650 [Bacillus sp. HMSC76G11]
MLNVYIFGLFLYFPEDKSEYLPAVITMFIFFLAAVAVFFLIKKVSKKEQLKAEELERAMKITNNKDHK